MDATEERDLLSFGKIMEVLGKNSETLMIKQHNELIEGFVMLFQEGCNSETAPSDEK